MSVINNHILQAAGGLGCTKASQHQQEANLYVRQDGTTPLDGIQEKPP